MKHEETLRRAARLLNDLSLGMTDEGREIANSLLSMANAVREVTPITVRTSQYMIDEVTVVVVTPDSSYMVKHRLASDRSQLGVPREISFPQMTQAPRTAQMLFHFARADVALLGGIIKRCEMESDERKALIDLATRVADAIERIPQ